MARTVRDTNLETRTARARLKQRKKPYWRGMDPGAHLGYYKGARGGSWIARFSLGGGRYKENNLGVTDDRQDADGVNVYSFSQAQESARSWFSTQARIKAGLPPTPSGPYTVENAIKDYLADYEERGLAINATRTAADAHILPSLGPVELEHLTTEKIQSWHRALAKAPARLRSGRGQDQQYRPPAEEEDAKRSRRATANRVLTILKAALNFAWGNQKATSDDAWRKVKPFKNVDAPVVRYLTGEESVRLVNASPPGFRPMVQAALLTGCRYGELRALLASDFNEDTGTLAIRISKSGKTRHVTLTEEGQLFFSNATAGKLGEALIFTRPDGKPWGQSHQRRPLAEACKQAKISPQIGFHILRHTHASTLAMKGVPLTVIASQLGHVDTRMTEKHYAHLAPNYVSDTIREKFPHLGIVEPSNLATLKANKR